MIEFKIFHKAQFNEKLDVFYFCEWGCAVYVYDYVLNKRSFRLKFGKDNLLAIKV